MNPIVLYLVSGESLYAGAALVLLVVAATPWMGHRWLARLRAAILWSGLAMMVMASPPLPWLLDVLFFAAFFSWLIAWEGPKAASRGRRVIRVVTAAALAGLVIVVVAIEMPYRARPAFTGERADHVVVIGDSLSAGIGSDGSRWPWVFQRLTGVPTINLSQPGAVSADGLGMAKKLTAKDRLVVIEIGGNDLIGGVSTAEISRNLDGLLAACCRPGRTVIMFELPLLPYRIGYGRSQRRLAEKYHVQLIPKRFLIEVLGGDDATSDGLHLSAAGAKAMADLMQRLLAPLVENRSAG